MEPLPAPSPAPAPDPRPVNYGRNAYHVVNALLILLLAALLDTKEARVGLTVVGAGTAWAIEGIRRLSPGVQEWWYATFGALARPHEAGGIASATWYATAVVVLAAVYPLDVAVAGLAVLGLGDPAAAIIGRRWGRIRTMHGRSLEGSVAFVVAGGAAAWATLAWWHPDAGQLPLLALAAAVGGAIGETVSGGRLDDNLVIPLLAAACAWGARGMGA